MFAFSILKKITSKKPNEKLGFLCLVFALILVSSCSRQAHSNKSLARAKASSEQMPMPIGFKKVNSFFDNGVNFFLYDGKLCVDDSVSFYKKHLERDGWVFVDSSVSWGRKQEGMLTGNKPGQHVAISIRPKQKGSSIHVFLRKLGGQHNADAGN